ncbi:MAG: PAS domain S-box protein, partial [Desulfuromonadales bacterium]|nr:PAS domain S-box protein [Desulfuromonadales bacterium]
MSDKNIHKTGSVELRSRAEERLGAKGGIAYPPISVEDQLRLLHELQVHQIELEMQNAELLKAREDEAAALEKYTDLYDFAPVGYLTLDRKGTIRAANLTASGLMGIERSRLIGRSFGSFVSGKTRSAFAGFLEKVFTSIARETSQVPLLKAGNSDLYVQIEGIAVASGDECRIVLIDISERKQAEEVLRLTNEAAEMLLQANQAAEALRLAKESAEETARKKSLFFANMSHELRTPMTGILGMLQLALVEDLAPTTREYLETTLSSARSLLQILNDILDMSKIEAGKLTIEEKPF